MLLQFQFPVLLMSFIMMVESNPQRRLPCPKPPGKGVDQDTIFSKCDYGVGGEPRVSIPGIKVRTGFVDSDPELESSAEGNMTESDDGDFDTIPRGINITTPSDLHNTFETFSNQTTTPTSTNVTVSGRQAGCTARPDPGECRGAFPRFYYNEKIDQCDCFLYGGCDEEGIVYTWLTLEECVNSCVPGKTGRGPGCQRATFEEVQRFLDSPRPQDDESINEIITSHAL